MTTTLEIPRTFLVDVDGEQFIAEYSGPGVHYLVTTPAGTIRGYVSRIMGKFIACPPSHIKVKGRLPEFDSIERAIADLARYQVLVWNGAQTESITTRELTRYEARI